MKDLTKIRVNDVDITIIARQRARYTADNRPNLMVSPGTEVPTADEILLGDGTVLYQCMHPGNEDCAFTHPNLRSVTAHQTAHGKRRVEREAREAAARAEAAERELAERIERRSNGSKQAAQTRRQKREGGAPHIENVPLEIAGAGPKGRGKPIGDEELAKMGQRVIAAYNAMQDAADEFQKVLIGYLRAAQAASECQPAAIDPDILAKAEKWDKYLEFQDLINKR